MIIERIGIAAPSGIRDQLGPALASFLGPTQVETGCLGCSLYQEWDDPNSFVLVSRWDSVQDLILHIQSDSYKKLIHLMELGTRPPLIEFLTVSESRGLDLIEAARQPGHLDTSENPKVRNLRSA